MKAQDINRLKREIGLKKIEKRNAIKADEQTKKKSEQLSIKADENYIRISSLSKHYNVKQKKGFWKDLLKPEFVKVKAVDGISFSIRKGELVGFIGPNGAGKTTTIKMLVGILWPTSGSVLSAGYVPYNERKKYLMKVGVVFGQRKSLWPELSVKDNLELISSFYGLNRQQFLERLAGLENVVGLAPFIDRPFRKLSLGQQMRAELVGALLHQPEILFLDEPTIGMDIIAKFEFIGLLKRLNQQEKTTILLTSHDLNEIESLCKRIIIINAGQIVYDGSLAKIRPSKVVLQYEEEGIVRTKQVEKKDLVKELSTADLSAVTISEIPIEEVVQSFYKNR